MKCVIPVIKEIIRPSTFGKVRLLCFALLLLWKFLDR